MSRLDLAILLTVGTVVGYGLIWLWTEPEPTSVDSLY